MNLPSASSRQPQREPWTIERLISERAIALGSALSEGSHTTYSSALQSYLAFCKSHIRPVEPTEDTLSFYVVYMSRHINPSSVQTYLSGICNQLEPFYPLVRQARNAPLVSKTLKGCKKLYGKPVSRKAPLSVANLSSAVSMYGESLDHDDSLFLSQLLCGFFGLMRLGELCWPDKKSLQDWRQVIMRHTVTWFDSGFGYLLPGHKGDKFWEGNQIVIQKRNDSVDPYAAFTRYLQSRDRRFPHNPQLWIRADGSIPQRSWFERRLKNLFPAASNISGHSMRAGGATALAEAGVPDDRIQAMGRRKSDAFKAYIRKNPVLLHALILGRPLLQITGPMST